MKKVDKILMCQSRWFVRVVFLIRSSRNEHALLIRSHAVAKTDHRKFPDTEANLATRIVSES